MADRVDVQQGMVVVAIGYGRAKALANFL